MVDVCERCGTQVDLPTIVTITVMKKVNSPKDSTVASVDIGTVTTCDKCGHLLQDALLAALKKWENTNKDDE